MNTLITQRSDGLSRSFRNRLLIRCIIFSLILDFTIRVFKDRGTGIVGGFFSFGPNEGNISEQSEERVKEKHTPLEI